MIPGKGRLHPSHRINGKSAADIDVLKTALIYGANASGKSSLIKSMKFAKNFILQGAKAGSSITLPKFKLAKDSLMKPSRFEFEFKINGFNYAYGFLVDYDKVIEEWLYQITKFSEKAIFERGTSAENKTEVKFSGIRFKTKKEQQFMEFIALGTRANKLFLSECLERNVSVSIEGIEAINNALKWFIEKLTIIFPDSKFHGLEFEFEKSGKLAEEFKKYMKIFDTGIDDIELKPVDFDKIADIPDEIKEDVIGRLKKNSKTIISDKINNITYTVYKNKNNEIKAYVLNSRHKLGGSNEYVSFDFNEESDGTQRLIDLIPALVDLSKNDKVFIIDELDRSLHPNLSRSFIDIFLSSTEGVHSQLIVTTHETSLLNLRKIRKDEIWFVEKNKNGEAQLYSLEEFKPRFDKEIRRDYLVGRFGAVPSIVS
jgi:AAA15 family ATPase/GTPase